MSLNRKVAVVGLGYVGLPVAVAFGRQHKVIGFDINDTRVQALRGGSDHTGEVSPEELRASQVHYTSDPADLGRADFIIVAVPTPVDTANRPDFRPLAAASRTVGRHLAKGSIVVYESTVYPGATEEICQPILEQESGLKCGTDFWLGYSPERINPGDREHSFERITKVVSGQTPEIAAIVAAVYGSVVKAGTFTAASIKVAEAAKVIENTQRDLNIALMNELSLIFRRMGIDTLDVLEAAGTKWNFLRFMPGLVGGHCIGVDPYYLTHKAEQLGYHPQVILAGRRINDGMGESIADAAILCMVKQQKAMSDAVVTVLGLTFKENVPDLRNSGVAKIVKRLREYGVTVQVHDPIADPYEAMEEYGIELTTDAALKPADAVILAVSHRAYVEGGWEMQRRLLREAKGTVLDVKGILPRTTIPSGIELWRL